jgi:hypothetical protein
MSLCFFCIINELIYLNIRFSNTAPFFFHATPPTSVPLSQLWTTSTITWRQHVGISNFQKPSVPPLLLERKRLIATTTKQISRMCIGLPWVGLFTFSFIYFLKYFRQFSTLATNYTTLNKPDGMKPGSKHLATSSVPNLIKHMHSWMSRSKLKTLKLRLLLP